MISTTGIFQSIQKITLTRLDFSISTLAKTFWCGRNCSLFPKQTYISGSVIEIIKRRLCVQLQKYEELKLSGLNLKSMRAMRIRESFQDIYNAPNKETFARLLKKWYFWATHSRLEPISKAARTIKNHWDGVVAWRKSQINNGILEGLNSIVQVAKAKARGFRNTEYFKTIIHLITGKLNFEMINPHIRTV